MSKTIRRTFTVVEVINGRPSLTNYANKKDAEVAFEKIVGEQYDGAIDPEDDIAEALATGICNMGLDYYAELQETDLIG